MFGTEQYQFQDLSREHNRELLYQAAAARLASEKQLRHRLGRLNRLARHGLAHLGEWMVAGGQRLEALCEEHRPAALEVKTRHA